MSILKNARGFPRQDSWTSEHVRERWCVQMELSGKVKIRALRWFGDVEHTVNDRLTKKAYESEVERR